MFTTTLTQPRFDTGGLAAFGERWRAFAAEVGASFFQDWGWVGCLAQQRFADPLLVEVTRAGRLVAMALFNRRVGVHGAESLYLHESTDPELSSTFIEHNGPLVAIADPVLRQAVLAELLIAAMGDRGRARRLVLPGVAPDCAGAAVFCSGVLTRNSARLAPYVDFAPMVAGQPFIERLSRNTRHQLRRSNRRYAALGPLTLDRAETADTGLAFLAELIRLHEVTWHARGKAGAFATEEVRRFYKALVAACVPTGEVDLLRIAAGSTVIGYLMNFRHRGIVSAYQSGFNYAAADPHQKPGLTSHYLAIDWYRAFGVSEYDFLAGADRYKLSLANAQRWLHWVDVASPLHPAAIGARLRRVARI